MAIKESLKRLFSETWVKIVSGVIASLFLIFFGSLLKYSKQIINSFILIPPILLVVFGILELFVISLLIVLLIVIYNKYKSIVVTEEFQTHFSVLWRIDKKNKSVDEMPYCPSCKKGLIFISGDANASCFRCSTSNDNKGIYLRRTSGKTITLDDALREIREKIKGKP